MKFFWINSLLFLAILAGSPLAYGGLLGEDIQQSVSEGGVAVINTGQGDVTIGITLEQHHAFLAKREKKIREELRQANQKERGLLERQLKDVQDALADSKRSYEERIAQLIKQIEGLEEIRGQVPDDLLNEAQSALAAGDSEKADTLFARVEEQAEKPIRAAAEAAYQRGSIAEEAIDYRIAYRHFKRAVQLQPENVRYVEAAGRLAQDMGDYRDAVTWFSQLLDQALDEHGEDHPKVSTYRNNLGLAWKKLGEYRKAIDYYELALKSALKNYGEDHPKVATYRNNLGLAWKALGEYRKAIDYYELALASDLKTFGEDHPQIAIYRNNLGSAWKALGEYRKAIDYYELALASDLKTFGEDHPQIAIYRNNLGSAWQDLGEYRKAIDYYELALKSALKTFGEDHPDVAIDRNNLGSAWKALGEYRKAIDYYELALASDLKTFGEDHPDVAIDRNNLGSVWQDLGEHRKAIDYFELALKVFRSKFGENHPYTQSVKGNLEEAKNKQLAQMGTNDK